MLFNSYEFVFLFFPLTMAGYFFCLGAGRRLGEGEGRGSLGKAFLLAASLLFYGWSRPGDLPALIGSMAVNYGLGRQMERTSHKNTVLMAGLFLNLAMLVCFKYFGGAYPAPLGISFFTFTQIAFLMECYRESFKEVKLLSYGLYVGFFPKIMQGPIALPGDMMGQFEKEGQAVCWERIYRNLYLFVLGMFKKVLIADTLGGAVDFGYAGLSTLNSGDGLIVMVSYTLQLYFDFSGYCDMAMGIAGMLGFDLPINFRSPYKAANILEFWKGWHITLTRFFTQYLYIPLGGNRKGIGRTYLNCLAVFFLSGLWHGAGWQFIVWGMMHGILYVITRAFKDRQKGKAKNGRDKMWNRAVHGICVLLTFLYVNIAWIFFRAPSVKEGFSLIKIIGSFSFGRINWNLAGCFNLDEFWYVIKVLGMDGWQYAHYILMTLILSSLLLLVFFGTNAVTYVKKVKPGWIHTLFMAALFVWSILSLSGVGSFLYVNF